MTRCHELFCSLTRIQDGWQTCTWDKFQWILNEFLKKCMQPFLTLLFVHSLITSDLLPELTSLLSIFCAHLVKN